MGSPVAANYADLFMDMLETSLLNDFHKKTGKKLLIWLRFIDDIFFIWTDVEDSLKEFLAFYQKYSETKNMKSVITSISYSSPLINKPYVPPSFQKLQTLTSTLTQNLATLNI